MVLGESSSIVRVGKYVLRAGQVRALDQVRAAFDEFGGALLADPPGTGKTVVALAVAAGFERVLVIAPAALRAHWTAAASLAGVSITLTSHEALSRRVATAQAELVIVDEAHNARTRTTRRYARLASACMGARILLISATPVVNRATDRDALLALFLGSRAAGLTQQELGRCVVRRTAADAARPRVTRLPPLRAATDVPGVEAALRSLPPPLPAAEGSAATALVIMSLALAWRSSLAALDGALRRRVQRGEAFADLLRAGQRPSHAALRGWIMTGEATQLEFPVFLASTGSSAGPAALADSCGTLERHLSAVRALRALIRPWIGPEMRARADALRALASARPSDRIVVFARHADTIRSLYAELRMEPQVVSVIGARVLAASGRWTREEILRAVGPRAGALRAGDLRSIRILLATDVIAEGVEMQGVRVVVHADLPWTPARIEQRVGRVTRLGSRADAVEETRFAAPAGARALVRLAARLARKAVVRRAAVRDGEARGRIEAILGRWLMASPRDVGTGTAPRAAARPTAPASPSTPDAPRTPAAPTTPCGGTVPVAAVAAPITGFVAVIRSGDTTTLLCGRRRKDRWRISSASRQSLRVLVRASGPPLALDAFVLDRTMRLIRCAMRRRAIRTLAGTDRCASPRVVARTLARLDRILRELPALRRAEVAVTHRALRRRVEDHMGAAREERVAALLSQVPDDVEFVRRLTALLEDRNGVRGDAGPGRVPQIAALLLLSPPIPSRPEAPPRAPTSASP